MRIPGKRQTRHGQPEEMTPKERRAWRRAQTLSDRELLSYVDEAGAGMSRGLQDYRKESDVCSLYEMADALTVLKVVVEELIIRCETEGS